MVACVTIAFFGAFAFGLSGLQEQRSQHLLYAEFRGLLDPSSPIAPSIGGTIAPGTPVALLNAPGAGIHNVVIVEGTTSGDLMNGPGHLRGTPLPGQAGESIVLGKSTTAGAPFSRVARLDRGDALEVRTGQGLFHFKVVGDYAPGRRLPSVPSSTGLLTLVTSRGAGIDQLVPGQLTYVVARLEGRPVAAPHRRPGALTASEVQGHEDPSALPLVIAWLAALLASSVIAAPVLFAILWGFSNEAMRLLPNVY
jgi:sortase A